MRRTPARAKRPFRSADEGGTRRRGREFRTSRETLRLLLRTAKRQSDNYASDECRKRHARQRKREQRERERKKKALEQSGVDQHRRDPYLKLSQEELERLVARVRAGCRCNGHHLPDPADIRHCLKCGPRPARRVPVRPRPCAHERP